MAEPQCSIDVSYRELPRPEGARPFYPRPVVGGLPGQPPKTMAKPKSKKRARAPFSSVPVEVADVDALEADITKSKKPNDSRWKLWQRLSPPGVPTFHHMLILIDMVNQKLYDLCFLAHAHSLKH